MVLARFAKYPGCNQITSGQISGGFAVSGRGDPAIDRVASFKGEAGAVLVTPDGRVASDHNSREFCVASQREGEEEPIVTIRKGKD